LGTGEKTNLLRIIKRAKFGWKEPVTESVVEHIFNRKWGVFCGLIVVVGVFIGSSTHMDAVLLAVYAGLLVFCFTVQRVIYTILPRKIFLFDNRIKMVKGMGVQIFNFDGITVINGYPVAGMFTMHTKFGSPENIYLNSATRPSYQEVARWFSEHGIPVEEKKESEAKRGWAENC
jgi:hypothetical protein